MHIRKIKFLPLALTLTFAAFQSSAQSDYSTVLSGILSRSRAMKTASLRTEAAQSENMTGLTLSDPEVDFIYQWGANNNPDKVMLDVTQSFDFATLSGAKKKVARELNSLAAAELKGERARILSEADALMTQAVYCRKLEALYASMEASLTRLSEAAGIAVEKGLSTAVDANSIRIELSTLKAERKVNLIELKNVMSQLNTLAGGELPAWTGESYLDYSLPADFASWSQGATDNLPSVAKALAESAAADAEIGLRKKEGLPEFSLGYSSEMVTEDNHYGVKVGVSLPLWANKGRVKAAKAAKAAAMANLEDERINGLMNLRMKFEKAAALGESAAECTAIAKECDNSAHINKLYELGRISETDCLSQLQPLFSLSRQALDAEYSYQQALADFRATAAAY